MENSGKAENSVVKISLTTEYKTNQTKRPERPEEEDMKRMFLAIVAAAFLVFFASFALAQDISIRNTNTNTATATGGNADQQQQQGQKQKQQQKQEVSGVEGNQTVTTPLQAPLMGVIVGPGGAEVGQRFMMSCNPAYQSFTIGELEMMAKSGSFFDKRGSFFDAMTASKVRSVVRSKKDKATSDQIRILNQVPSGTKVLGTFTCTGDYGWSTDEALSKCLLQARVETNTSNVVVYQINDVDAANSGTAVGAGAGMSNPFGDGSVGAGSVAASFGKTHSMKERVVLLEVYAYEDVIEASNVCSGGQQVNYYPPPQAKDCDPQSIYIALEKNRIAIYGDGKKKGCDFYSLNNLRLRAERGRLYLDLYRCTGDREALNAAKDNFEIAARNYKFGSDIKKHQAEADEIMAQVYADWAEIGGK